MLIAFIVCQYSLASYRFPFHSVDCFFCCAVLKFEVVCLFLLLLSVFLVSYLINHCQIQFLEVFPCISSRSCIGLIFIYLFKVEIFIWCNMSLVYFFCMRISSFPNTVL